MTGSLERVTVGMRGGGPALEAAADFLASLGARVRPAGAGAPALQARPDDPSGTGVEAHLADPDDDLMVDGLPVGVLDEAAGLALAGAVGLALWSGGPVRVWGREVACQVLLPSLMAASYGAPDRTRPAPPRRAGDGWVACELATEEDEEAFERLLGVLGPGRPSATQVARRAQEWRLPVLPYRPKPRTTPDRPIVHGVGPGGGTSGPTPDPRTPPLGGVRVLDLTSAWAGPLTTWLLAAAGAEVHKVEPDVRLDGFRALDGRGIYPGGDPGTLDGNTSALFNALNRNKRRVPWDLRAAEDRHAFLELASEADVVVDSFSPRVMPNLGLTHRALTRVNPRIISVSMPAFGPRSPRRRWVAYGTGIHAISGLGDMGDGRFTEPLVSYPDPLCGLAAFAAITLLLWARRAGHVEVPLESPTRRLARVSPEPIRPPTDPPDLLGDTALRARCALQPVEDGAGRHLYPRAPFRGPGIPLPDEPAPALGGT